MARVHGPAALLPSGLKAQCATLLPRLRLIPELHQWLATTVNADIGYTPPHREPVRELWDCLVQGPPLLVLLDLLGSPSELPHLRNGDPSECPLIPPEISQQQALSDFSRRIRILETQGILSHGETFTLDNFLDGTAKGFAKVLKTVQRVLDCLEATYPGLYELPPGFQTQRDDVLSVFLSDEVEHMYCLQKIQASQEALRASFQQCPVLLDCLSAYLERMIVYQRDLVFRLEKASHRDGEERWETIFSLDDTPSYISGIGAYQSYCADYPIITAFVKSVLNGSAQYQSKTDRTTQQEATVLANLISRPIKRLVQYPSVLSNLLVLTNPIDNREAFTSLCTTYHKMDTLTQTILEVGQHVRSTWTVKSLKQRAFNWQGPDPESLGMLLMDDCVVLSESGYPPATSDSQAFWFESMLLLCVPAPCARGGQTYPEHPSIDDSKVAYPIDRWEIGLAARRTAPLNLAYAISPTRIQRVCRPPTEGSYSLEVVWLDSDAINTSMVTLSFLTEPQFQQWISMFRGIIPEDSLLLYSGLGGIPLPVIEDESADDQEEPQQDQLSTYLSTAGSRRTTKARPWSLRARKDGTPVSSVLRVSIDDRQLPTSPSVLPQLFDGQTGAYLQPPKSPLSISIDVDSTPDVPDASSGASDKSTTPPPDSGYSSDDMVPVVDLTGQITRLGKYPMAHGGYADVWMADWDAMSGRKKVAVKVLRGRIYDGPREEKMIKRLRREIRVWQRLSHENIIPLFGTCSDFGPYISMVCPWLENGNLRKYMQRKGDALKLTHRLKLLCEVATGLAYLHSFSVVHGDLSSSNILITDREQACLCDFGLSNIAEDFLGTSYFTSCIGGAVRWAAPELYDIPCPDDATQSPHATSSSDVYSYGSVALEILSGDVPYHHLKSDGQVLIELSRGVKPPRPPSVFITDDYWSFISTCWSDSPNMRPSVSEVSSRVRNFYVDVINK
ncbi:kinase-like protein [Rickenella mellea]|uniref:Kinase-like protein n=1 Tax=Rickenella mellea TaxID=50990 RepID=A0A4Y7PKN9_9AGAM|nr:kinase-like protein [Rickenella mellea]